MAGGPRLSMVPVQSTDILVLDTSALIDGKISPLIEEGRLSCSAVVVPVAAVDELQAQASKGREPGFLGLEELKRLRRACEARSLAFKFEGDRPTLEDIQLARSGRIDALIRDVAKRNKAVLVTADYVQALVAEAEGVRVWHYVPEGVRAPPTFTRYFDEQTMSVHLKEGVRPYAKRGAPGSFRLVTLDEKPMARDTLEQIVREINEAVHASGEGSIEISRQGATVIQLGSYRIAITRPPFSDALEVTIVRPIVRLSLEDYRLSAKLVRRLASKAEGILIAGPPGSGKTTLASSLADFYASQKKVVKTFESPRDLQVVDEVTQYGPLEGDFEKASEILLLVRPDYTVFDEIRKTKDFEVFADMRLAGVGMIGVVHASDPVDAVQRFIGRVELGMIPHIIDTVIFVKDGQIRKVYELSLVVKVPTGMVDEDLSRPVVELRDFESGLLEYEIYTFGEENVIVPVREGGGRKLEAGGRMEDVLEAIREFDPEAEVEFKGRGRVVVKVDREHIPRLIGRDGATISEMEERLGVRIDVRPRAARKTIPLSAERTKDAVQLFFHEDMSRRNVCVLVDGLPVFDGSVGRRGVMRIPLSTEAGRRLAEAMEAGRRIEAVEK